MILKDYYATRNDGVELYITYSDEHLKIRQIETGKIYENAVDVEDAPYTYEETDEHIEEFIADAEPQNALDVIFGGV